MLKHLMAAVLCTAALSVTAADQGAYGQLKSVYALSDGGIALVLTVDPNNCPAPGTGKTLFVYTGQNGVNSVGARNIYAAALLAKATGSNVSIGFDDATSSCYVSRLRIEQ